MPGVDSASKNEYQDIPGGKGGRCVRVTTLPPSCAECLVILSLNRPEPSGPHRPVIGIALPYPQYLHVVSSISKLRTHHSLVSGTTYNGAETGIRAQKRGISGHFGKLHSDGLQNLHSLTSIIWVIKSRWMRWAGHMAHTGNRTHTEFGGKPEGKRLLRRPMHRW